MFKSLWVFISKLISIPFKWYRNILLTLDFMTNAITLGDPRETISSVLGKMRRDGTCILCGVLCGFLSTIFMEKEHCKNSINLNVGRGTDDDMSPIPNIRRKWSNGFVVLLIVMFIYKDVIFEFIGKIS